jgi:AcrR family transcriptional regulator
MTQRRTREEIQEIRTRLVGAAREIVLRDGASSLTMRNVAREAGCAVGLPYKFFANREEIVLEVIAIDLAEATKRLDAWVERAGTSSVGTNLNHFANIMLRSHVPALLHANPLDDALFTERLTEITTGSGILRTFDGAVADYLKAEQALGRIRDDVNPHAFGFLITGAIHNLVTAGPQYPRPAPSTLRRYLSACADLLVG